MAENNSLERLDSYQYPNAHIGHLEQRQAANLDKFKQLCQSKGYYTPAGAGTEASHDDETLLRYLRARKWIPADAFAQFKDTEDWRKENQLDKLYEVIDLEEYDQSRRLYPQWTGRRDKRGIPVYVFEVAHLNHKAVSAYESSTSKTKEVTTKVPPKMMRLFALYENLTTFVLPLCSHLPDRPYPETPVSQSNNIVDISKVGLKQFWNLKAHMQDASQLATAHYPETLDRIFIIGAPSFFPTVWGWIKRWFDPITVSKIFILSHSDMKKTLEQYIEPQNIPKKYGGTLDYEFGQLPNLDPAIEKIVDWSHPMEQNGKKTIPTGPIKWRTAADGTLEAVAVGSDKGKHRDTKVFSLHPSNTAAQAPRAAAGTRADLGLHRTTTGVATHPPTPPTGSVDDEPPLPGAHSPETGSISAQGGAVPDVRPGTSSTRYQQQEHTHGAGQLEEGTPHTRSSVNGDQHCVMEPNTVAQAPKEYPVPEPVVEGPSYVEQAKSMASDAYASAAGAAGAAMTAVGLKKEGEKVEESAEEVKPHDPAVDNAPEKNVEEMLRARYNSVPQHKQ